MLILSRSAALWGLFILSALGSFSFCHLWGLVPTGSGSSLGSSSFCHLGGLEPSGDGYAYKGGCIFSAFLGFFVCFGFLSAFWVFCVLPPLVPSALPSLGFLSALGSLSVFGRFFPSLGVPSGGGFFVLCGFLEGHLLVVVFFFFCFSLVVFAYAFGFSF